jgi:carotenoid cleavage dioxygenase-like enzyme
MFRTVFLIAAAVLSAAPALATADLDDDVAAQGMRLVHGRAPDGLERILFRNGRGKFRRAGGSANHWFDGDGLMRSFTVENGGVTLAARFADRPKRRTETELEAVVTPGFGTAGDARARVGSNAVANPANTAVMITGERLWALWEGGSPLAMDAATLATADFVTLRPDLKNMPFQAHPRFAPDGTVWNVGTNADQAIVWHLNRDDSLIDARVLTLPRASCLHDFTASERSLIFVLRPWVFDHAEMPFMTQFAWKQELGTQVLVIDKADLTRTRLYEMETFSFVHLGDGWEEGVFVPKPGTTVERDAWLTAPSINLTAGVTELHAFDAAHVEDGPVATWRADVALPAGFHGAWRG